MPELGAVGLRQGESIIAVIAVPRRSPAVQAVADQRQQEAAKGGPDEGVEDH